MKEQDLLVHAERRRETVHLWLSVWIVLVLSAYRIVAHMAGPIRDHVQAHTNWPVAEALMNGLFFWLLALLWLAYRQWREAVLRQRELERVVSAISPDVLLVVNANRTITMCNGAVSPMFGFDREEVLGEKSNLLYSDRRVSGKKREIFSYLERVGFHVGQATGIRKDGSRFPIELITGNIRGQEGVVILIRDITPRAEAESALRLSEERFSRFMQHLPACAFIRHPDGTMLYANEPCRGALDNVAGEEGLPPGAPGAKAHGPSSFAADDAFVVESGQLVHRIEEVTGGNGKRVYDVFKFPIPIDDGPPMVGGIAVDITERVAAAEERRRLEVQMLQSQKLESLGRLGGGIAHDFNNLLAGILGYADLASMELPQDNPVSRYLEEIITASKRAAELCNQLLAYSGQGRFVIEIVSLTRMIQNMEHLLKVSISKKAAVTFELDPDVPGVECDATQLRQVIMNLAINASDAFADRPGNMLISAQAKTCDRATLDSTFLGEQLPEGKYVVLSIKDDGCGMDSETLHRMFDPFFSTKFTGRGLGLAAVMGIVRGHGGAIRVTSESGRGTTFDILLPATHQPVENTAPDLVPVDEWTDSGTILVVDDEPVIRDIAGNMLRRMGFEVITAQDGAEAVGILKERGDKLRAVLLDMTMPVLGGLEVYDKIRAAGVTTPVIFSSGYNKEDEVDTQRVPGALFLQKPYEIDALRRTLRELLEGPTSDAGKSG